MSVERLVPDDPDQQVVMSAADQSALLDDLAETKRRERLARKELEKRDIEAAKVADSKFGFLTKLGRGIIRCAVYRENPKTLEFQYCPEGQLQWDVEREDKAAFQDRIARLFGGGRFKVEMRFPKESGMDDDILELSIADKQKEPVVVEKNPVVSNDSAVAAQFASVLNEMQKSNRELLMVVMQQGKEANAATLEAMKAALQSPSRDSGKDDTMLKLLTAAMNRPVGEQQKQPSMLEMLTGMATLMGSLKTLMPQATAAGVDTASLMAQIVKAMELGAGLASGGGGGEIANPEAGGDVVDKLAKLAQVFGPFLAGLLTPKPQFTPAPPQIQPPTRPPVAPQPAPRPQTRDVRPGRPQPATTTPAQRPIPQPPPTPPVVDQAKMKSDIDKLVDTINNLSPEDSAAAIRAEVDPAFIQLAENPDNVLMLISNFRPELASDGAFGIKLRQVCAALKAK
jgi:hypothetical protein